MAVPRVPGVPRLSSYAASLPVLVLADVVSTIRAFGLPQWGLYAEDGQPVIIPATALTQQIQSLTAGLSTVAALLGANIVPCTASMVDFDYARDAPISDYPVEQGGFQTYNKVVLPFDVRLKLACSGTSSQRQSFQNTLDELLASIAVISVVTPERSFRNCNCTHVDYRRTANSGVSMIIADVWFKQVNQLSSIGVFINTQQPFASGQQSIGNVQAQVPSGAVSQQLAAAGGGVN